MDEKITLMNRRLFEKFKAETSNKINTDDVYSSKIYDYVLWNGI